MRSTGRLPIDVDINPEDCFLGSEFSGVDLNNERVMGIVQRQALATAVSADLVFLGWKVPRGWSLEEAATVPVVYATAYQMLIRLAGLRPGESVLIHSGRSWMRE
jgi:fatty acid synthase, animal type